MRISKIISLFHGDTLDLLANMFGKNNSMSLTYNSKDLIEMSNVHTIIADLEDCDKRRTHWRTALKYNNDGYFTCLSVDVRTDSGFTSAFETLFKCIEELGEYPILSVPDYSARKLSRQVAIIQKCMKCSEKDAKTVWSSMFTSDHSALAEVNGLLEPDVISEAFSNCFHDHAITG
jgi:hypothetical protein